MVDKIQGPLGIWPFPILNTLIAISNRNSSTGLKTLEVHRDENGRITSVEEITKDA